MHAPSRTYSARGAASASALRARLGKITRIGNGETRGHCVRKAAARRRVGRELVKFQLPADDRQRVRRNPCVEGELTRCTGHHLIGEELPDRFHQLTDRRPAVGGRRRGRRARQPGPAAGSGCIITTLRRYRNAGRTS